MEINVKGLTEKEVKSAITSYVRKKNRNCMELDPTILKKSNSRLNPGEMVLVKKDDAANSFGTEFREVAENYYELSVYSSDPEDPNIEKFEYSGNKVFYVLKDAIGGRYKKRKEQHLKERERAVPDVSSKVDELIDKLNSAVEGEEGIELKKSSLRSYEGDILVNLKSISGNLKMLKATITREGYTTVSDKYHKPKLTFKFKEGCEISDLTIEAFKKLILKEKERYIDENTI